MTIMLWVAAVIVVFWAGMLWERFRRVLAYSWREFLRAEREASGQ